MIVDPDFADHWKTRMLVDLLEGDEAAPVYLIRLWSHCQNRRANVFPNINRHALKAMCRFPGAPEAFESALLATGFVRREGDDLIVHQWDEYNSALIQRWDNGKKGGRPKGKAVSSEPVEPPLENPPETGAEPDRNRNGVSVNRSQTDREEESRMEGRGAEQKPSRDDEEEHARVSTSREIPNWPEVRACADAMKMPEWRARDWFDSLESVHWKVRGQPVMSWKPLLTKAFRYWESDGRPMQRPGSAPPFPRRPNGKGIPEPMPVYDRNETF